MRIHQITIFLAFILAGIVLSSVACIYPCSAQTYPLQVMVTATPATVNPGSSAQILVTATYYGQPMSEAAVDATTNSGSASLTPFSSQTDSSGRASFRLDTTTSSSGTVRVSATVTKKTIDMYYAGNGYVDVPVPPVIIIPLEPVVVVSTTTPIPQPQPYQPPQPQPYQPPAPPQPPQQPATSQQPVADISVDQYAGNVPLTVNYDGRKSYAPDGSISQYAWRFGDGTGSTGGGILGKKIYYTPGTYVISLVVTDNNGLSSNPATIQITAFADTVGVVPNKTGGNQQPVAVISVDNYTGKVPLTVYFDGRSSHDPDGSISQYVWDFGDGHRGTTIGYSVMTLYTTPGTYVASLVVTDNNGLSSNPATIQITAFGDTVGVVPNNKAEIPRNIPEIPAPRCYSNDCDNDGIPNSQDNCPTVANPDQTDSESIPLDICHIVAGKPVCPQQKGDGIGDSCDNCWNVDSKDQTDSDHDCELVLQNPKYFDGIKRIQDPHCGDVCDNCKDVQNPDQTDSDNDGVGNACDNCWNVANLNQNDYDNDCRLLIKDPSYWNDEKGWLKDPHCGDTCDNCKDVVDPTQTDSDNDSVGNVCDNCRDVPNLDQKDSDNDNVGDACDTCRDVPNLDQKDSDNDCTLLKKNLWGGIPSSYWNDEKGWLKDPHCGDACQNPCDMHVDELTWFSWANWRGMNWMTSVKDQKGCGSCWAEAPIGAMEAQYNIEQGGQKNLDLTEQAFVSVCFVNPNPGDCLGGSPDVVLDRLKQIGVPNETCFPYQSTNCVHSVPNTNDPSKFHDECNAWITGDHCSIPAACLWCNDWGSHPWKISSYGDASGSVETVKKNLLCHGPLSVCSGKWYHCVVLVGWDNNFNGGSWIIKNSWGTKQAYLMIPFSDHDYSDIKDNARFISGVYHV